MTDRREILMGAACVLGAGAAYALIPRKRVSLLGAKHVADIVPRTVGDWSSRDVSDLVAPKEEDSLASRLYGETVGRVYHQESTGANVMMLLAHGDTQSDDLQLHRPEICYPAFGYWIEKNHLVEVPLAAGAAVPARNLVAQAPDRRETILYWSRLGEYFPTDQRSQHLARTRTSMKGIIADGLLARFSVAGADPAEASATMQHFVIDLIKAVRPADRAALIGSDLAARMERSQG